MKKTRLSVCAVILILSLIMILFGIKNGKCDETRGKGSMICLECIGLG